MKRLILLAAFLIFLPIKGQAQESSETLKNYVPPPMFGAPRPVPPKKAQPKVPKMPKLSQPVDTTPAPRKVKKTKPLKITPRKEETKKTPPKKTIIPLKKPEHPKENFTGKPPEQVPEKGVIEKNKISPGLEPIDLLKKQTARKTTSQGVVKGPKTMPSNKKQSVESEILFEPENKNAADLIDRVQEKTKETTQTKIVPLASQNFDLPSFNILADGQRKLNIIFIETQNSLNDEQLYTLDKLILPFLKENKNTRLQILSYASPQENGLVADKRIALSRAMAVREHIIERNISANRLDIRSLGAQTDIQPMDRIEIFLLK